MITVKKDAIKYKDSGGNMQSAGVLCQVGTFGVDWLDYAYSFSRGLQQYNFEEVTDIELFVGKKRSTAVISSVYEYVCSSCNNIRKVKLSLNTTDNSLSLYGFCSSTTIDNVLKIVDLTGISHIPIREIRGGFNYRMGLEQILGELDVSECGSFNQTFGVCDSLKEIRFKAGTIKVNLQFQRSRVLSDESIQSIIDGLADLTGQTAQTLTLHADVKAKLSEEQIATITSKNWTLA